MRSLVQEARPNRLFNLDNVISESKCSLRLDGTFFFLLPLKPVWCDGFRFFEPRPSLMGS